MSHPLVRLLLADDDKDDCLIFEEALQELPWSVDFFTVYDGEQLMQHLINTADNLPTVLFLDLNMPRKNGFECLIEIKQHTYLKDLPVIVYSTSSDPAMVALVYTNGAQYYIRKPSDFSKLKRVINEALTLTLNNPVTQPEKENFVLQT